MVGERGSRVKEGVAGSRVEVEWGEVVVAAGWWGQGERGRGTSVTGIRDCNRWRGVLIFFY